MSIITPIKASQKTKPLSTSWGKVALFLAGPIISVVVVGNLLADKSLEALSPLQYYIVALAIWCPFLPISLPAVLTDKERDSFWENATGIERVVRSIVIMPYMCTKSPARFETIASIGGFAFAVLAAWAGLVH